jgi:hypothetical protein
VKFRVMTPLPAGQRLVRADGKQVDGDQWLAQMKRDREEREARWKAEEEKGR